ncbi:transposase [Dehalococcoidia bacterium]|nr:transposase [Dehalococcoidia bacterium]
MSADETGWQVDGDNHWLWVFTSKNASLHHIDESRGGKVVSDILGEKYQGFWVATSFSWITHGWSQQITGLSGI